MKKLSTLDVAFHGLYVAILVLFLTVPYTGFITIGPFTFTTIPIILTIYIWHMGLLAGMIGGVAFGLGSLVATFIQPGGLSPFFQSHPELLILPRVIMGICLAFIIKTLGKIGIIKFVLSVFISFLLNTMFFSIMLIIVETYSPQYGSSIKWLKRYIYLNMGIEWLVGTMLALPFFYVVEVGQKFMIKKGW